MGDKPAGSPMVEEAPSGGQVPVDELEAQVGNQPTLNDPTTGMQGSEEDHEVVPADEVQDSQVGDQPSPNTTTELQGNELVYEVVPADEAQESQVEDQPSPNPTVELQGNEQVHEVVPANEVQDSQAGEQSPPNSMQGDEEVHDVVPDDEMRDPQMTAQHASDLTIESGEDEFWPLSGKPFFDIIIAKSHVKPLYQMVIPAKIHQTLPSCSIPTILKFRGKEWEMIYNGSGPKRLDTNWRAFVIDNKLKIGDACVFELQESSSTRLVFRVQILRGDIPAEILAKIDGETAERPIVIK